MGLGWEKKGVDSSKKETINLNNWEDHHMRVITNKLWEISLVWVAVIIIGVCEAEALQPKLLWKKDLKFKVTRIKTLLLSNILVITSQG